MQIMKAVMYQTMEDHFWFEVDYKLFSELIFSLQWGFLGLSVICIGVVKHNAKQNNPLINEAAKVLETGLSNGT